MSPAEHLLALDIGTTSAKAVLHRMGEGIVAARTRPYQTHYPRPHYAEQDPEEVLRAVIRVVEDLVRTSGVEPGSVAALAFDGVWQSLLPVTARGRALARAMLWSDFRALPQSERLRQELDPARVLERTGCTIHPMYFAPRLLWFQEEAQEVFRRAERFVSLKEYILFHLFGHFRADLSIASGTGLLNMAAGDWDQELLQAVGAPPGLLSELVEPVSFMPQGLKKEPARAMGLRDGLPGVVGAADGAMAHLGSVGLARDRMSLTVGTGAALRKILSEPRVLPGREAWCYYLAQGRWLQGGIVHDAGNVMRWFADRFLQGGREEEDVFELINASSRAVEPGAEGLFFLPFLGGERCPHYRPQARGCLHGLSFRHGLEHLARALMEGIAFRLKTVYQMLAGDDRPELVITGGLLKSDTWLQIMADYFGQPLHLPGVQETTAWGTVLVGLRALGKIGRLEEVDRGWVRTGGSLEPDPRVHRIYRRCHQRYLELYDKIYGD